MKKIDKLLLTSFIGPFVVSFGIALFVLVMQFLWLYIDEIAGKGVSIFIMLELIGYLSISTFPMALPIAVLISSVMVMGNLAERYELSSIKSAGVSLMRLLRSLILVAAGIGFFSYVCSDFIIPIANLKFKSRLYDIRKQKPALTLEKGVFNEDFRQFVIRIGDKARDGETISDVMIEDQTNAGRLKFNQILADSGQMYTTADKRYFVMNLFNGAQYQEPAPQGRNTGQRYPFVRTKFKAWTKVWDLSEFEMNRTDEDRFKNQRSMLSMSQLRKNIDSLTVEIENTKQAVAKELLANLNKEIVKPAEPHSQPPKTLDIDSISKAQAPGLTKNTRYNKSQTPPQMPRPVQQYGPKLPEQVLNKPLTEYNSFDETFAPEFREKLLKEAASQARLAKSSFDRLNNNIINRRKEMVKTGYELFIKYSFALVCFVFLFIGAPMGAIIRKGGFGYPILVSIIFFVTFIMLTIMCRKLAEAYVLTPFWAAMAPCVALVPIGVYLTRKAMNDSQMINTDRFERFFLRMQRRFQKKQAAAI